MQTMASVSPIRSQRNPLATANDLELILAEITLGGMPYPNDEHDVVSNSE